MYKCNKCGGENGFHSPNHLKELSKDYQMRPRIVMSDTDRRRLALYEEAIRLLSENQNILDDQFVDVLLAKAAEIEKNEV